MKKDWFYNFRGKIAMPLFDEKKIYIYIYTSLTNRKKVQTLNCANFKLFTNLNKKCTTSEESRSMERCYPLT